MNTEQFDNLICAINGITDELPTDFKNDFGSTVGDELHEIAFSLSRIADALEIIAKK